MGMMPKKCGDLWVYPKTSEVLAAAPLKTMKEYITLRRQRVAALVVRQPVLIACREAERMSETAPRQYWQDQGIGWALTLEAAEAPKASDALVAAHADWAGQPAAAGTFIGIATAASGAAHHTNPWSVTHRTNLPSSRRMNNSASVAVVQGRTGGLPVPDGRLRYMEAPDAPTEGDERRPWIEP